MAVRVSPVIAVCVGLAIACAASSARAGDPLVLPLWPDIAPEAATAEKVDDRGTPERPNRFIRDVRYPELTVYLPEPAKSTGTAVVICPGGGYSGVAIDKEGHEVARWLNSIGVAGIVLKYRMPHAEAADGKTPLPLEDVRRALRTVRARAADWHVRPDRVGVMGFSAGGHLASMAATQAGPDNSNAADALDRAPARPDFAVLLYPVISMHDPVAHTGSRTNLLGKSPDPKWLDAYSSDQRVTKDTPPTFLVHAKDDKVKVENSLQFYDALNKAGVPAETCLFEKGGHGFGLGAGGAETKAWPAKCADWMKSRGLLQAPEKK
jgi:acetyl esterase/lipase